MCVLFLSQAECKTNFEAFLEEILWYLSMQLAKKRFEGASTPFPSRCSVEPLIPPTTELCTPRLRIFPAHIDTLHIENTVNSSGGARGGAGGATAPPSGEASPSVGR